MKISTTLFTLAAFFLAFGSVRANPPVASYIFPAGGQRGHTVTVKVGGLFLHQNCGFEMLGTGIKASPLLKRVPTLWFEGPLLHIPESQRAEDYPKDMAGKIEISADASPGPRSWRLWTSQGCTPSGKFMVGDLPEIVEEEIEGDPIPVPVTLPVTVNGRIFPREDVDVWSFQAKKGQETWCEVHAARLGSPLDARLEILDPRGKRIRENDDRLGSDPFVRFTPPEDGEYRVRIQDTRADGGQAHVYRLTLSSAPRTDYPLRELKDLPEVLENEPNDNPDQEKPLSLPMVFNGRIDRPGDVDCWTWTGKKGETWEFDLRAGRLGSPLDGVIRICDSTGKDLARAETTTLGQLDPGLTFTVPADGIYSVQVQDRFRSRGGPTFAYRLRVDRSRPDFNLWLTTDALTLPRNGQAKLKIQADRLGGFKEAITLKISGLPEGVTVAPTALTAKQNALDLSFKADETAAIQPTRITIEGSAQVGDQMVTRRARLKVSSSPSLTAEGPENVLLAVALPTPFKIKGEYDMGFAARGSVHARKYKIERGGYDGPIEISLADRQARHLQGVTGPVLVVPPGVDEFTYAALLPPWMETGRTCRVCVMGVGVIKEKDGAEHRVSFSSVNQNEQIVAVVGPGRLALELDRNSLLARPGKPASLEVRIKRGLGLKGPVKIEMIVPAHLKSIAMDPALIPADQEQGKLTFPFSGPLPAHVNMPVTIRAILIQEGQPFVAEAKLDIHPERLPK